jgi:hypothetical protein
VAIDGELMEIVVIELARSADIKRFGGYTKGTNI